MKTYQAYKVNPEYYKLVPRPTTEEYEALKQSIKEEGQWEKAIIDESNYILDGFTRNQICKELGIELKVEQRTFANELLKKIFIIEVNLKRRHLTSPQKSEMGFALEPMYAELAKQRHESQRGKTGKYEPLPSIEGNGKHSGETSEQTAKAIGLSRTTYERAKEVKREAPDLWDKVKKEELTIASAHETHQLTKDLSKEKQQEIMPKVEEIKREMRKADISTVEEKKAVIEKLAEKVKISDIDIERTVKVTKTESLTKDKSPEVQKRAIAMVEEKSKTGGRIEVAEIVREAEEEIKEEELIPSSEDQMEKLFEAMRKIPPPPERKEDKKKLQRELLMHIADLIERNGLACPKCGERKIQWRCGHNLLGD